MAAAGPAAVQRRQIAIGSEGAPPPDDAAAAFKESLLSREKLDRSSPEMWPSMMPGVGEYITLRQDADGASPAPPSNASWNGPLCTDDMYLMQQLSNLSTSSLIIEVKKLHDLAYKLGIEEAKEMTRGKYLNIFKMPEHR